MGEKALDWRPIRTAPHDGSPVWVRSQCYRDEGAAYYDAPTGYWCWREDGEHVRPSAEEWSPTLTAALAEGRR